MVLHLRVQDRLPKAFRNQFVLARRAEGKALLERAKTGREVRAQVEAATETYFYAPWQCLTAEERDILFEASRRMEEKR